MSKRPHDARSAAEEEARIKRGIASDPDTWELSPEALKAARPFHEVFPELSSAMKSDIPAK